MDADPQAGGAGPAGSRLSHAEALDAIELAAVEPGGLARLGRSTDAASPAVLAHLSTCAACAAELERLRRVDSLLRAGIGPGPSESLRGRTLALAREVGVRRGGEAGETGPAPGTVTGRHADATAGIAATAATEPMPARVLSIDARRRGFPRPALWVASLAAAVIVAVGGTALVVGTAAQRALDAEHAKNAALVASGEVAFGLIADRTALRIPMGSAGSAATGVALISPATYETAVIAAGLPEPPPGKEYACYVVIDGQRVQVGRMTERGSVYAWAGRAAVLAGARAGSIGEYGVLLVDSATGGLVGTPVITGTQ